MPRLVTQAVSEQPVVALIGEASPLRSVLASFFERHDFSVAEFSKPSEFSKENTDFYKVLFLEGWSREKAHGHKKTELDEKAYLEALKASLKLSRTVFFIQEHSAVTSSDFEYQRKKIRYSIETELPEVNIVLGQDVLFDTGVWWAWEAFTEKLSQGILFDLDCVLYPISFKAFIRLITPVILSPQQQLRTIIRGQEQPSAYIVAEISRQYELYHQKKLVTQVKKIETDTSHEASFIVVKPPTESLPTLLQEGVQSLPSPQSVHVQKQEQPLQKPQNTQPLKTAIATPPKPVTTFEPSNTLLPKVKQEVIKPVEPIKPTKTVEIETKPQEEKEQVVPKRSSVDDQLASLFSQNRTEAKVSKIQQKVTSTKKITTKNKKRSVLFLGGIAVVGAALGVMVLAGIFWVNQVVVKNAIFAQIKDPDAENHQLLSASTQFLQLQTDSYEALIPAPFFDSAHDLLALSEDWFTAQERISTFKEIQIDVLQQLVGKEVSAPPPPADQVAYEEISRLYSRFSGLLEEDLEPSEKESVQDVARSLEQQRAAFVTYQQLTPLLPTLLGQDQKRTYALLLQNDQELRATGGFLSAVAIVTLDQGQIIDTQVFSSYELDESLAAVITPPEDLKQVLGEERLYLRDSNWNPDFPTAAQQIRDILRQQLNKKIDGVIGLNLLVIEDLLRATGPLELDEYNELLTDRNLAERIEFHSEVTLVESDQSSDYSSVVLEKLLGKLTTLSREKTPEFLATVNEQLSRKNLLISFADGNESATFSLLGWTGEIVKPNCPAQFSSQNCVVDTLAVIDSNVGVNKANYHTARTESHQISLVPGQASHTHTVSFKNNAQTNAWPKGTYQSYLRFIVPSTAKLKTISINGTPLFAKDIIISNLGEFSVVGFVSSTPIQTTSKISIEYDVPYTLETGDAYTFFLQKQPGINQAVSSIDVDLNTTFKPALIAPQGEVINEIISFKDISKGHMFLGIGVK